MNAKHGLLNKILSLQHRQKAHWDVVRHYEIHSLQDKYASKYGIRLPRAKLPRLDKDNRPIQENQ